MSNAMVRYNVAPLMLFSVLVRFVWMHVANVVFNLVCIVKLKSAVRAAAVFCYLVTYQLSLLELFATIAAVVFVVSVVGHMV